MHEALVEVSLGRLGSAPELLEHLVCIEPAAAAHKFEPLGDARPVRHFREDRRMQRAPVVILVHGAWHGPWAWEAVIERLTAEGIRTVAVDLPSKGFETALLGDLHDDAEAVRAAVDAAGGPALVVAHSYGGLPVSEGLAGCANVAHLIYLTAFMLEPGESLLGLRGGVEPEWWLTSEDGRTLTPDDPKHVFYNDCTPEVAEAAAAASPRSARTCSARSCALRPGRRAPSTYVICERDNAIPPAAQEHMSAHADTVSRLDCRPFAVPLAPARRDGDHPGDARRGRRGSAVAAWPGRTGSATSRAPARVATPASEDEVVAEVRRALAERHGPPPGRRRPLLHARRRDGRDGARADAACAASRTSTSRAAA